jgi:ribosomal protein L12E/L44/L45/RPP1/RPP2
MDIVATYALLANNNQEVTRESMKKVLAAAGASVSDETLELFMCKIEGKSYSEIISAGSALMASQRTVAPAASSSNTAAKKVEVVEESESSSSGADLGMF